MSSGDNEGTFWVLGGLAVLVFAGVGLSLLVDSRSDDNKAGIAIQNDIKSGKERHGILTDTLAIRRRAVENLQASAEKARKSADELAVVPDSKAEIATLRRTIAARTQEIETLADEFGRYRISYREQAWLRAAGEKHDSITLRTGARYENVTIQRVTPAGLEITHREGLARLAAPDLPSDLQDRFQWNEEERQKLLKKELADLEAIGTPAPAPPPVAVVPEAPAPAPMPAAPSGPAPALPPADLTKIQNLRVEVMAWRTKLIQLESQFREAERNNRSGGNQSVPGSLETWSARYTRLSAEIDSTRVNYQRARAQLQVLSPADPALNRQ